MSDSGNKNEMRKKQEQKKRWRGCGKGIDRGKRKL